MDEIIKVSNMIMKNSRNTLSLKLPFLNIALGHLDFISIDDFTIATNGKVIVYSPIYLIKEYKTNQIKRNILHSLFHCIFQHMFTHASINRVIWNLSCDIAVENIINELNLDDFVSNRYQDISKIRDNVKFLSAEHIYNYLITCDSNTINSLLGVFDVDDHEVWYNYEILKKYTRSYSGDYDDQEESNKKSSSSQKDSTSGKQEESNEKSSSSQKRSSSSEEESNEKSSSNPNDASSNEQSESSYNRLIEINNIQDALNKNKEKENLKDFWKEIAETIKIDLETFSKQHGDQYGSLVENLKITTREKQDYTTFLKKFATFNEAILVNEDEFDYIFYTYGLKLNGNIPLIEPLEYKEIKQVKEFVIAIDTSGSVQGSIVYNFLVKTFNILMQENSFNKKVKLYIIQCDTDIQSVDLISDIDSIEKYMSKFKLRGFGGTDFRPVFSYVNELIKNKDLINLKGMIYFTDACGPFPEKAPDYKVAIGYFRDYVDLEAIPSWAIKLELEQEDFKEKK